MAFYLPKDFAFGLWKPPPSLTLHVALKVNPQVVGLIPLLPRWTNFGIQLTNDTFNMHMPHFKGRNGI